MNTHIRKPRRSRAGNGYWKKWLAENPMRASLYSVWASMKDRCSRPTAPNFRFYGGRGITVCERWLSFENFAADMYPRPPGTSLDRIDTFGNYEPGNCRWATLLEQHSNKRDNVNLTFAGKTQTLTQWANGLSVHRTTLQRRLGRGWSLEKTLTTPPQAQKP